MQQWYQCPKCGALVAPSQNFCGACGAGLFGGTQHHEWPPLHILSLNQQSKLILGFRPKNGRIIVLPAITTDGKLSMLPAGYEEQFCDLQGRVRGHINSEYNDCQTHICLYLSVVVKDSPKFDAPTVLRVWNVSGSLTKVPELDYFYDSMSKVKVFLDPYWLQLEQFFGSEPQKSWINNLITHLKKECDWANYVARTLSQSGFDYTGRWTDEVWVSGVLQRL